MKKKIVVFTCGCFDLFHAGHLKVLEESKKFGDYLIVGISSDNVIRKAKGKGRPIIPQDKRVKIVSALGFVDEVVIGTKKTFVDLILKINCYRI